MARRKKINKPLFLSFLIAFLLVYNNYGVEINEYVEDFYYTYITKEKIKIDHSYSLDNIPEYNGNNYIIINNNEPNFNEEDKKIKELESYSELDYLGRCGVAYAIVSKDTMPTKERESIQGVKPSGWHTVRYDKLVEGKYLYNRCHLIGYQLASENANPKNLITCTRQMNTGAMLEYENKVTNYIKKSNNHVLYRVTPIFKNENLVADGVEMEALSIEDNGKGIKFHIFVYNIQEGIEIDYSNGESKKK